MVQHMGGGTCEYLPGYECGCMAPKKCGVVDEATGRSDCVLAGSTPSFSQCATDADCAAGAWCNHSSQVCQPICVNTASCTTEGGLCEQADQSDGKTPIPGLKVCAAHCDLVTAMPCGPHVNCVNDDTLHEFECVLSAGGKKHASCTANADCAPTLACIDTSGLGMSGECLAWCTPPSSFGVQGCSTGFCNTLQSPVQKGSTSYGVCSN
jgi:hypothetical protein